MQLSKDNTTIGFIGIGVMGKSMARHLLNEGYRLHIYTRTKAKAEDLLADGAIWENSVAVLAGNCNVVFTIVGFPPDVEEVYLGEDGILANIAAGSYVVDMTTSKPELAVRIYDEARNKKVKALDAPVSGGDIGAREARLSIMVGGDREAYTAMLPVFALLGKNIVYQGGPGSGQHAKMCNQIVIAGSMMGVCEALAYAVKSGLDPLTVLKSIESGAAASWTLSNLGPRIIDGNFAPGFYVKHFIKDMTIAAEAARAMDLETPGLDLAKSLYERLAEQGGGNHGTQALYKLYV
jgi:3-hydroxyisobutyrate dehydrogenase